MLDKRFINFDNFIFDLDGTVWWWDQLVPRAIEVFQTLKRAEKNIIFITNNSVLTRDGYAKKLQNFGISAKVNQIINPSIPARKLFQGKKVFCIGEGIITDLRSAKIKVCGIDANCVLVSEDRALTYDKLAMACEIINLGADFYKTASGGVWIMGKKRVPGAGAIAAALETACGKKAELIGKPSKYMIDELKALELDPKKTILFGDECDSDIAIGNRLGFETVLVLTGRDSERDYLAAKGLNEPRIFKKSLANILS